MPPASHSLPAAVTVLVVAAFTSPAWTLLGVLPAWVWWRGKRKSGGRP